MKKIPEQKLQELIKQICADRKVRIAVTRESHEWFFTIYLGHYVQKPLAPFHEDLFWLTDETDWKLLCVVAFRGSGKSTIFTMSYALWGILGRQQKKFVLIFCQTRSQAKQHMMNLRRELETNALLKSDLGPFQEVHDSESEWSSSSLVFSRTNARITVASTEQAIRGLRNQEYRPDLVICDDVEDIASTKTQESRDKTYQWFTSEVLPIGDTSTKVVVVGNLLHEDSLLMRLKNGIETKQREGVFRRCPLINESGAVLWPGKYPNAESIEEQKRTIGNESAWQREYLLRIITDDDQIVRPEWIQYYDALPDDGHLTDFRFAATGIDLAISEKQTADYTAMVSAKIHGQNQDLRIYILPNPINERLDFPKTVERAKNLSRMVGNGVYSRLYIENTAYQQSLVDHLRSINIPAGEFKPQGQDKRARLTLATLPIQAGKVLFPRKGAEELIRQLIGFGKERYDDLADAFAILALKVMSTDTAPFFSQFSTQRHVIEPFPISPPWFRFRSIVSSTRDGFTSCHWIAVDSDGVVYVYKEYYKTGLDSDQHAENIKKLSEVAGEVQERYRYSIMDVAAFGQPGYAETRLQIYERHGVTGSIPPGKKQVMSWESVHRQLRGDKKGVPTLKIFSDCPHLIRTLQLLVHDPQNREEVDMRDETATACDLRNFLQTWHEQKSPKPETSVQKRLRELYGDDSINIDPDDL